MSVAYYNGKFQDFSEIRIPLSDRCVFFGDGVYDAAIGRGGKIYLEDEHIERFFTNAERLNIPICFTKKELSTLLREVIEKNGFEQYFLYFQITRYSEERSHSYPDSKCSNLLITLKNHTFPARDSKIKLVTADDIRYQMCDVKTLNLLPAVLASKKAELCGCGEAVFIKDGFVTECAHSNISIIKNGILYTHPNGSLILPGITRARLLFTCRKLDVPYIEMPVRKEELYSADEILITSTTKMCISASEIDRKCIPECKDSVGKRLIDALYSDFDNSIN